MAKQFFTFGHGHYIPVSTSRPTSFHHLPNAFIDVTVENGSPRDWMFNNFGPKWSMQYDSPPYNREADLIVVVDENKTTTMTALTPIGRSMIEFIYAGGYKELGHLMGGLNEH